MKPVALTVSDSESNSDENPDVDEFLLGSVYFTIPQKQSSPPKKKLRKINDQKQKTSEEKAKLRAEKLEEKTKLKEEKLRQKLEKKKTCEFLKRLKPGECMKYISIIIDSDLLNCKFGGELLIAIQTAEIQYKIQEQKVRHSLSWIRKEDSSEKTENYLTIIWTWRELIDLISSNSLRSTIQRYLSDYSGFQLTLIIFGIEEYFRLQKTQKNRKIRNNVTVDNNAERNKTDSNIPSLTVTDIEMFLVELQLFHKLQYRFVETSQDVGSVVVQFTKSLAELPFKLDRNKKHENTDWYATADSKESVKVDTNGNGMLRLWQQQICQFPLVGFDVAQAIVSEYNSPQALIEAYDLCKDKKEAELLLQDIPVRRAQGPLTSVRRIGPELSKKIFIFFNTLDGNICLAQES